MYLYHDTQYLHVLQLLFAEDVLFLQRLILDLHTDQLSLHLNTLILQLRYKTHTHTINPYKWHWHLIFHLT